MLTAVVQADIRVEEGVEKQTPPLVKEAGEGKTMTGTEKLLPHLQPPSQVL